MDTKWLSILSKVGDVEAGREPRSVRQLGAAQISKQFRGLAIKPTRGAAAFRCCIPRACRMVAADASTIRFGPSDSHTNRCRMACRTLTLSANGRPWKSMSIRRHARIAQGAGGNGCVGARTGVEPIWTAVRAVASPLCYLASKDTRLVAGAGLEVHQPASDRKCRRADSVTAQTLGVQFDAREFQPARLVRHVVRNGNGRGVE